MSMAINNNALRDCNREINTPYALQKQLLITERGKCIYHMNILKVFLIMHFSSMFKSMQFSINIFLLTFVPKIKAAGDFRIIRYLNYIINKTKEGRFTRIHIIATPVYTHSSFSSTTFAEHCALCWFGVQLKQYGYA